MSAPSTLLTNRQRRGRRWPNAAQRQVRHRRAEVAAADADVDDGADALGRWRRVHAPLRTRSANAPIRSEHLVHVGHDVVAVDLDDRAAGGRAARCAARLGPR